MDRLKLWLRTLTGDAPPLPPLPLQAPTIFPRFPGLDERPWRDGPIAAATALESHFPALQRECARVERAQLLHYDANIVGSGAWSGHPVFFSGERVDALLSPELVMDETARIVRAIEGQCCDFPLGDVLFSAHAPGTTLTPHCSWDGFRMRLHLGLKVPSDCGLRVGTESRSWEEGRTLVFHDSFEHETWNRSHQTRVVLIVDCWHPDLTQPEREALLALTRKREVRGALMSLRVSGALAQQLHEKFAAAEQHDPLIARFWRA